MAAVATQDPARWNGEWRPLNLSESPDRAVEPHETFPAPVARPSGACWEMGQARGGKLAGSLVWAVPQQQDRESARCRLSHALRTPRGTLAWAGFKARATVHAGDCSPSVWRDWRMGTSGQPVTQAQTCV